MQATIIIPYPGTVLFDECKGSGLLNTLDWSSYDMKAPVMKIKFRDDKLMRLVRGMYLVSYNPEFLLRKIINIRHLDDLTYFGRASKKVIGHLKDFALNKLKR